MGRDTLGQTPHPMSVSKLDKLKQLEEAHTARELASNQRILDLARQQKELDAARNAFWNDVAQVGVNQFNEGIKPHGWELGIFKAKDDEKGRPVLVASLPSKKWYITIGFTWPDERSCVANVHWGRPNESSPRSTRSFDIKAATIQDVADGLAELMISTTEYGSKRRVIG